MSFFLGKTVPVHEKMVIMGCIPNLLREGRRFFRGMLRGTTTPTIKKLTQTHGLFLGKTVLCHEKMKYSYRKNQMRFSAL